MGHIVAIGTCYSGLLGRPNGRYNRIVLATPLALRRVQKSETLQRLITSVNDPHFRNSPAYVRHGVVKDDFETNCGEVNVGLRLTEPQQEEIDYQAALSTLRSMARGIHRRIMLISQGLKVSEEIDTLRPDCYAAMLADISERQQDPRLRNIAEIGLSDTASFHSIEGPENARKIIYSIPMLSKAPTWAHWEEA